MGLYRKITNSQDQQDPSAITAIEYNKHSGSMKVSEVGRRLIPLVYISGGANTYTTDGSTARVVNLGACLAIYNNDTAIHSITLGSSSAVTVLAPGVTNASGGVGVPLPPGQWTYLAVGNTPWLITDSALALVFVIEDDTTIGQEWTALVTELDPEDNQP